MTKLTPAKIKKILELHRKDLSERKIAKKVGCHRSTVWYHINKMITTKYSDKELSKK